MAMRRSHDAVYAEKYTDRDGNEKTRYTNVGALLTRDDGSMVAKIEAIPVGFTGWINFYVPKERDAKPAGQSPGARSRPVEQTGAAIDDQEIPF